MKNNLVGVLNTSDQVGNSSVPTVSNNRWLLKKTVAMYATMVAVSTCAIF